MAVVVVVGMNGSHVKKASGQWSALSAKVHDGTSHTKMTEQKTKSYGSVRVVGYGVRTKC